MKIGLAIPTRGDRNIFLSKCLQMMNNQTRKADLIHVVSEAPKSEDKDITYRYKKAFKYLFKQGCDVVFLIEDDDFYSEEYIETMLTEWIQAGKPDVFGTDSTTYYHLNRRKYKTMKHVNRSSAFSTMVTKEVMNIDFPKDNEPFLDMEIWKQLNGKTFAPANQICLGIKHGVGLSGGRGHNENFPYDFEDENLGFLKSVVGEMFESYKVLTKQKYLQN